MARSIGLLAGICLVAAACTVTLDAAPQQTCTVGKAGTDLQITYSGPNANASCQAYIQTASSSHYLVDQPDPTGALVCRYTIKQITVTVRDKGVFKFEGSAVCDELRAQAGA